MLRYVAIVMEAVLTPVPGGFGSVKVSILVSSSMYMFSDEAQEWLLPSIPVYVAHSCIFSEIFRLSQSSWGKSLS